MPYEFYKILHIISIFLLLTSASVGFFYSSKKSNQIIGGVSSLFILISGMGLLARIGIGGDFPLWVILKIVIWLILAIGIPISIKRFKNKATLLYWLLISFAFMAAFLVIYKPF